MLWLWPANVQGGCLLGARGWKTYFTVEDVQSLLDTKDDIPGWEKDLCGKSVFSLIAKGVKVHVHKFGTDHSQEKIIQWLLW